jgi:hypothetical protein
VPSTTNLILALVFTWLIEWCITSVFLNAIDLRVGCYVLLLNAITNPLAHAVVYLAGISIIVAETGVVLVEIPLFYFLLRLDWRRASVLSLAANLASALIGHFWV